MLNRVKINGAAPGSRVGGAAKRTQGTEVDVDAHTGRDELLLIRGFNDCPQSRMSRSSSLPAATYPSG